MKFQLLVLIGKHLWCYDDVVTRKFELINNLHPIHDKPCPDTFHINQNYKYKKRKLGEEEQIISKVTLIFEVAHNDNMCM